jgi:hypothetical protein
MSGSILYFPMSLRGKVAQGISHVRFKIDNHGEEVECDSINLFVPQGFSMPDSASYSTMDLGAIGQAREVAAGNKLTEADAIAIAARTGTMLDSVTGGLAGKTTAHVALEEGIAVNPYTETTFTNSNIRSFGFTFKLVSENKEEADAAAIIENIFRKYLYPDKKGVASLKYPAKFNIGFFNSGKVNKYMPKIMETHLVNCTTTYNSTTNAFHDDGQPVEVDMALTFQETKPLVRSDLYGSEEKPLDANIRYSDEGHPFGPWESIKNKGEVKKKKEDVGQQQRELIGRRI